MNATRLKQALESAEAVSRTAGQPSTDHEPRIEAVLYQCRDARKIPLRPWIYGRQLLRGSLAIVVATGAVGKTSLLIGTALALVTGRPLLQKSVWGGPKRVWLWNLEESADELSRLIEAARLHWLISEDEIGARLFVNSALEGDQLCIAVEDHAGFRILEPVVEALVKELIHREIDLLVVDPFVSSHSASENNNGAIDAIAKQWSRVGVRANCAVCLVHHTKKATEATADAARGASALPNAARSVVVLNRMAPAEAAQWGIQSGERRSYFRVYDDKNNRAPPASKSDWYQLASVDLGNGSADCKGDSVQVVIPWTPPDAFTGMTWEHLRDVQAELRAAGQAEPRKSSQSPKWAGFIIGQAIGLNGSDPNDKARIKSIISEWLRTGALIEVSEKDAKGEQRPCLRPGVEARPEGCTR